MYKRTANEDESPLPMHDDEDGNGDIEMDDLGEVDNAHDLHDYGSVESSPVKIVYKGRRREVCYFLWAVMVTIFFLITIIIAIAVHKSSRAIHWCCVNDDEVAKCTNMSMTFQIERFQPVITCIHANSLDDCVHKIDKDIADVVNLPNNYLYKYKDILYPVMAEDYHDTPGDYGTYFVAIAERNKTRVNLTHSGLTNLKFSVMKKDLNLTFGFMLHENVVNSSLCKLTPGDFCPPYGVARSSKCLNSTVAVLRKKQEWRISKADVRFMDHLTMLKYFNPTSTNSSNYQLLCPNGKRANLSEYKSCNLLQQPVNSLVVSSKIRSDLDIDVPTNIMELLHVAQLYFGSHTSRNFNMFVSKKKKNLLFQDNTEKLLPLRINCTAQNYLGEDYVNYMDDFFCAPTKNHTYENCMLPQYN